MNVDMNDVPIAPPPLVETPANNGIPPNGIPPHHYDIQGRRIFDGKI